MTMVYGELRDTMVKIDAEGRSLKVAHQALEACAADVRTKSIAFAAVANADLVSMENFVQVRDERDTAEEARVGIAMEIGLKEAYLRQLETKKQQLKGSYQALESELHDQGAKVIPFRR